MTGLGKALISSSGKNASTEGSVCSREASIEKSKVAPVTTLLHGG